MEVWAPRVLTVLRIMVGLLFLEHGTQKIFGFPRLGKSRPGRCYPSRESKVASRSWAAS